MKNPQVALPMGRPLPYSDHFASPTEEEDSEAPPYVLFV